MVLAAKRLQMQITVRILELALYLFTYLAKFGIVGRHLIFLLFIGIGYVRCIIPAGHRICISSATEFLAQFVEEGLRLDFFLFDVLINCTSWLSNLKEKYWVSNEKNSNVLREYIPITTPRTQIVPTLSSLWIKIETQNYIKYVFFLQNLFINIFFSCNDTIY